VERAELEPVRTTAPPYGLFEEEEEEEEEG
jgi:hypothetical protein